MAWLHSIKGVIVSASAFRKWRDLSLLGLVFIMVGCDNLQTEQRGPRPDNKWIDACNQLKAEIAGLDEEIRLRLDRVWDVKWRMKASIPVNRELYKQMLDDDEKVIQARTKRAKAVNSAQELQAPNGASCSTPTDHWDISIIEYDCLRPRRADNSEGLAFGGGAECEAQFNAMYAKLK